jgi:TonB-linked SusC/RagA family outer membrane protein
MKLKLLTTIIFSCVIQTVFAQKTITGSVADVSGISLPGATIIIKGTTIGTQTDFDGGFTLQVNSGNTLVVIYLGFITQEIKVTNATTYQIVLLESLNTLNEIVVVGYGTQKKAILTSSVSSVKGEDLAKEPVLNAVQALQGKAAGVQVVASDAPGSASTVIIRGLGTLQGGREPLYVVDGLLTNTISNINTSDIKTMNVLKDAASLAIYGNRGANGVIIITTKKGRKGKMKLSFDFYTGFRDILYRPKMADASSFVTYTNEALLRTRLQDGDPTNDNSISGFLPTNQQYNTNWLDEITRMGQMTNHNLSLSGGSENIQAFFSVGFNKEEGILKGNDFNRFTVRSNVDYKISEKLNFSQNISVQLTSATPKGFNNFTTAYKQAPIIPVIDENVDYGFNQGINNVGNPVVSLLLQDQRQKAFKLQASFKMDYKISDPLVFTSRFSVESGTGKSYNFSNSLLRWVYGQPGQTEANYQPTDPNLERLPETVLTVRHTNNYRWFLDNYFTYDKTFNEDHTVKLTLGVTAEENRSEFLSGTRNNVPSDSDLKFNLFLGDQNDTQGTNGSLGQLNTLYSYIGRLTYDYKDKYIFNASYRRDGSSQFQEGFRFGDFFAFSTGWVLSSEDFMENSVFNILKVRASYGELGNQNVPLNVVAVNQSGIYPFGSGQDLQQGSTITGAVQQGLSWEKTNEFNIGAEFTLLDYRLSGEIDYYQRVNENATLQLQLPDIFGVDPFNSHVGEIKNTGIEAQLNWADKINDKLSYHIGGNFAYNKNELTKTFSPYFVETIGGNIGNGQYTKKAAVGQPLGSFFLYEVDGIDDRGELVYKDLNNDGAVDEDDRRFFGSYIPKYTIGFNFGFNYKNFDFNLDTFTNLGSKVYNGKKAQRFGGENIEQDVFNNRWTSGRASNTTPKAFNEVPLSSNYYLESGDFFRINNITLGYTIPGEKLGVFSKLRIYATAKNPIMLKKFSGFTPELPSDGNPLGTAGIELNAYPTLRSFFVGINTSF